MSPELIEFIEDKAEFAAQVDRTIFMAMTCPPGPVAEPGDCPGFGQELHREWTCQDDCTLREVCFKAYLDLIKRKAA